MNFDEIIPAYNIGDMVPVSKKQEAVEVRHCPSCDSRLSRYNPETRCSPCREKERDIIIDSLNAIFDNDGKVLTDVS
jgi:hypothetical protein